MMHLNDKLLIGKSTFLRKSKKRNMIITTLSMHIVKGFDDPKED